MFIIQRKTHSLKEVARIKDVTTRAVARELQTTGAISGVRIPIVTRRGSRVAIPDCLFREIKSRAVFE